MYGNGNYDSDGYDSDGYDFDSEAEFDEFYQMYMEANAHSLYHLAVLIEQTPVLLKEIERVKNLLPFKGKRKRLCYLMDLNENRMVAMIRESAKLKVALEEYMENTKNK